MEKISINAQTINVYVSFVDSYDDPTYRDYTPEELDFLSSLKRYATPKKGKGKGKGKRAKRK